MRIVYCALRTYLRTTRLFSTEGGITALRVPAHLRFSMDTITMRKLSMSGGVRMSTAYIVGLNVQLEPASATTSCAFLRIQDEVRILEMCAFRVYSADCVC